MSGQCKEVNINGIQYTQKDMVVTCKNYFLVRTYSAGVFAGEIEERNGKEVTMKNARRIWYWEGANSLSQLATEGTSKPNSCKFPCEVNQVILTEVIEILPCTKIAMESIKGVPVWNK